MTAATAPYRTTTTDVYRDRPQAFAAAHQPDSERLKAALFCGPFSMIDDCPLNIISVPGMTVRVNKGSVWVTDAGHRERDYVRAGEAYVTRHTGVLTLSSARRTELKISLP